MNNSFARLVDGMVQQLRHDVLTRLEDDYAKSQLWGVINALNTFKARADWSPGLLVQQIEAQRAALAVAAEVLGAGAPPAPAAPAAMSVAELMALRDEGNRAIGACFGRLDADGLEPAARERLETALRDAMRAEMTLELKHSPRPLFLEMSGG